MGNTLDFSENTVIYNIGQSFTEDIPIQKHEQYSDIKNIKMNVLPNNDLANKLQCDEYNFSKFDIYGDNILKTLQTHSKYIESCDQFTISNNISQSTKWMPYWEILYPDYANRIYHDYVSTENNIQTTNSNDIYLEKEGKIVVNDKRLYVVDMSIIFHDTAKISLQFPLCKLLQYKNPNYSICKDNPETLDLYVSLKKMTTLSMNQSSDSYTEKQVDRTSVFVYYPKTTIYLLINTIEKKIYCMQSMTNQEKKGLNTDQTNLVYLKNKLTLPPGWMYSVCMMDKNTYLVLVSNKDHYAKVINDDLNDSYQYVRPEEAPFLYSELLK